MAAEVMAPLKSSEPVEYTSTGRVYRTIEADGI